MSRAEFKQGLKRKYERLKRKAVNCDNSSTELLGKIRYNKLRKIK